VWRSVRFKICCSAPFVRRHSREIENVSSPSCVFFKRPVKTDQSERAWQKEGVTLTVFIKRHRPAVDDEVGQLQGDLLPPLHHLPFLQLENRAHLLLLLYYATPLALWTPRRRRRRSSSPWPPRSSWPLGSWTPTPSAPPGCWPPRPVPGPSSWRRWAPGRRREAGCPSRRVVPLSAGGRRGGGVIGR